MQLAADPMPLRVALLLCVAFFAFGCVFMPYTGAQYDEVLFASPIYPPHIGEFFLETPIGKLPVMVMTYVGAVKTWLLWPLLKLFGPSHVVMRLPMLVAATVSIFLFFLALRRLVTPWIAVLATALLATDVNYLLTSVFDWGPVALQHLFLTFALYGGIRFAQERQRRWLIAACFAVGLGLWDKAISIWLLGGFGAALLLVYPRQMWQLAKSPRTVVPAVLAFVLGCSPLIYYNWVKPLKTFTSDVSVGNEDYLMKISQVDTALAGDGLRGYLTRPQAGPKPQDLKIWGTGGTEVGVSSAVSSPKLAGGADCVKPSGDTFVASDTSPQGDSMGGLGTGIDVSRDVQYAQGRWRLPSHDFALANVPRDCGNRRC